MAAPDTRDPRARDDRRPEPPGRDARGGGELAPPRQSPGELTRPPGAHPLGIGAGAAAGGAAGALIGAAAGPVGAFVGGALGAVAGGYIGREAAEAINPTAEDRYWAEAYARRPYVITGETYEYYRPAYHFGWESYGRYADAADPVSFDELEPRLAADWAARDASATLPWERARPAARDAWNRVAGRDAGEAIEVISRLRGACLDSAKAFEAAAASMRDPAFAEFLRGWADQRGTLADELTLLAARYGSDLERPSALPPPPPGPAGAETRTPDGSPPAPGPAPAPHRPPRRQWMNVRDAASAGPFAVMSECEHSEGAVIREYDSALVRSLPSPVTSVLQRHYTIVRVTHDQVRSLRDAVLD